MTDNKLQQRMAEVIIHHVEEDGGICFQDGGEAAAAAILAMPEMHEVGQYVVVNDVQYTWPDVAMLLQENRALRGLQERQQPAPAAEPLVDKMKRVCGQPVSDSSDVVEALRRAEMKMTAYLGVCKDDKELPKVISMVRAALSAMPQVREMTVGEVESCFRLSYSKNEYFTPELAAKALAALCADGSAIRITEEK